MHSIPSSPALESGRVCEIAVHAAYTADPCRLSLLQMQPQFVLRLWPIQIKPVTAVPKLDTNSKSLGPVGLGLDSGRLWWGLSIAYVRTVDADAHYLCLSFPRHMLNNNKHNNDHDDGHDDDSDGDDDDDDDNDVVVLIIVLVDIVVVCGIVVSLCLFTLSMCMVGGVALLSSHHTLSIFVLIGRMPTMDHQAYNRCMIRNITRVCRDESLTRWNHVFHNDVRHMQTRCSDVL